MSKNLVADPSPLGRLDVPGLPGRALLERQEPYRTHAGAPFQLGAKGVHGPEHYLHIDSEGCFVAGGMWMPEPGVLQQIRQRIADEPTDGRRRVASSTTRRDALKRPPRGFDPDHPMIEDIKRKSFTSSVRLTDKQVTGPNLMKTFMASRKQISPLMRFLAASTGVPW